MSESMAGNELILIPISIASFLNLGLDKTTFAANLNNPETILLLLISSKRTRNYIR